MSLPDSGCDGETGVFSSVQDTTGPEHTGKGSLTLTETGVFSSVHDTAGAEYTGKGLLTLTEGDR